MSCQVEFGSAVVVIIGKTLATRLETGYKHIFKLIVFERE